MEFDDIQKIWDAQKNENIYVINETTIHNMIRREKKKIKNMVNKYELITFFVMTGLALFMIVEGLLDKELYQIPEGIILMIASGFIYWDRKKRKMIKSGIENTILEDLNLAIRTIDYQIERQKNFFIWFTMPIVITLIIHFMYTFNTKPWWLWIVAAIYFIITHWLIKKEIKYKYEPRKYKLLKLRTSLTEN